MAPSKMEHCSRTFQPATAGWPHSSRSNRKAGTPMTTETRLATLDRLPTLQETASKKLRSGSPGRRRPSRCSPGRVKGKGVSLRARGPGFLAMHAARQVRLAVAGSGSHRPIETITPFPAKQEYVRNIPHAQTDVKSLALELKILRQYTSLGPCW